MMHFTDIENLLYVCVVSRHINIIYLKNKTPFPMNSLEFKWQTTLYLFNYVYMSANCID